VDPDRRAALERAYRATTYRAGPLRLRVGERSAALDAMLAERGADEWAYLTAWNPGSQPCPEAENRAAQGRLLERLAAWPTLAGESRGDDASWPAEPSVLVLGIGRGEAMALAREFGQAAILAGRRSGAAELVWVEGGQKPHVP